MSAVEGNYCAFALIQLVGSWCCEAGQEETEPTEDAVVLILIQNYFLYVQMQRHTYICTSAVFNISMCVKITTWGQCCT